MTTWIRTAAVAACLLIAQPLFAQWPAYPTKPAAPRKADGTPNLEAPAPRTKDGHVDFTGVWDRAGGGSGGPAPAAAADGGASQSQGSSRAAAAGNTPAARNRPPPRAPDGTPYATFFNVGAGIPGGAPYQPLAAELRAERMSNNQKNNPDAHCLPMGLMQLHLHPQPRKIVQTPTLMVIMYEGNSGLRQIYLDGRPLPEVTDDLTPWWYGYSTGHWEGDTLVVETVGFRNDVWLDVTGSPFTSKGKMTERFTRTNFGTLQIDVTLDDPTAYTKPFTVRVVQHLTPNTELIEFICQENEASSEHYDR
jgi:hypothetical protein